MRWDERFARTTEIGVPRSVSHGQRDDFAISSASHGTAGANFMCASMVMIARKYCAESVPLRPEMAVS